MTTAEYKTSGQSLGSESFLDAGSSKSRVGGGLVRRIPVAAGALEFCSGCCRTRPPALAQGENPPTVNHVLEQR
jgi:hypothetical protein